MKRRITAKIQGWGKYGILGGLLWAGVARGEVFFMDFPVKLNGAEVAQLSAGLDGFELHSVVASEFADKLQKVLSPEVLEWLKSKDKTPVTIAEFAQKGITLKFLQQDMLLEMALQEQAMATDSLSYGRSKYVVEPDGAASWSFLSNLNVNHRRNNNNQSYDTRMEWLMEGNVGGAEGVNFNGGVFFNDSSDSGSDLYRGDLVWFYDEPEKPRRFVFGDTQNRVTGHLSSYQLGGFAIESAYAQLQPQRNLTPSNSQVFVLPRHATIEVFVNGFMLSRVRLRPGRYDINDLPLTSGSNQIRIVATYADGKTDEFDFTSHYNAQLLSEGISDYSFAIGRPTQVLNNVYHYDGNYMLSGSYEYGVSDTLTVGANGAAMKDGQVAGLTATMGYDWGNISTRYTKSRGHGNGGHALSVETEHSVFGQSDFGSPNLRLGFHAKRDFTTTPWQLQSNLVYEQRFNFDYSYYFNDLIDVSLYGSVRYDAQDNQTKELTTQTNWRYEGMNVSFGYSFGDVNNAITQDQSRFFLNFTWSLFNTRSGTRQRVRYSSRNKTLSASHTKINQNYLGDYGYEVTAERGSGSRREQLRSSYTGRIFRTDVTLDNSAREGQLDRANIGVNLSTSVGIADGKVGMGTNISAPFAVISKHRTLGDAEVLVNVSRQNKAQTQTGDLTGALISLGTSYNPSQFNIDVPEAPFGYDWGPGTYKMAGGAATGHHIQIGSSYSFTVMGVLLDDKGEPVSLKRGTVTQSGHDFSKTVFTNRAGRFVVEGIGPGEFLIQFKGLSGKLVVEDGEERFIDIGDIRLSGDQ